METILSEEKIKDLIKQEGIKANHPYKDESDLMFDAILELYEKKEISENVFKIFTSKILLNLTESAVNDLRGDLIRTNLQISNRNSDKIFFVNYSKKKYA